MSEIKSSILLRIQGNLSIFYPLFAQIFKRSQDGQFTKRHRRIISTISVISHTEKRAKTLGFKILKRVSLSDLISRYNNLKFYHWYKAQLSYLYQEPMSMTMMSNEITSISYIMNIRKSTKR